jgi:hypothetical protein
MRASIQLLRNPVAALVACGVDAHRVLEQMGASWSSVFETDDDERIPVAQLTRFWEATEAVSGDPSIGVRVGAQARLERFGALGGAVLASSTLGDALLKSTRYVALMDERQAVLFEKLVKTVALEQAWFMLDVAAPSGSSCRAPSPPSTRLRASPSTKQRSCFRLRATRGAGTSAANVASSCGRASA